jgi:hypothetical protein
MNKNIKDFEEKKLTLTNVQITWMKRVLFGLIIVACYFVVNAAWIDLYNPGSHIARDYQTYAIISMIGMAIIALPLWVLKLRKIEEWKVQLEQINDPTLKNKLLWSSLKPVIYQIIMIGIVALVAYVIIVSIFHIPQPVIDNYKHYYTQPHYP